MSDTLPSPVTTLEVSTSSQMTSKAMDMFPSVDGIKAKFSQIFDQARPWSEFANTSQMAKPHPSEVWERMQTNFSYFFYNYAAVLTVLTLFTILTSPLSLLGIAAMFGLYNFLFLSNTGSIQIAGVSLDSQGKSGLLAVSAILILWLTGAGATFASLFVTGVILASVHAALRKSFNEADFETVFEGNNV